jgi:hypothetical protein
MWTATVWHWKGTWYNEPTVCILLHLILGLIASLQHRVTWEQEFRVTTLIQYEYPHHKTQASEV